MMKHVKSFSGAGLFGLAIVAFSAHSMVAAGNAREVEPPLADGSKDDRASVRVKIAPSVGHDSNELQALSPGRILPRAILSASVFDGQSNVSTDSLTIGVTSPSQAVDENLVHEIADSIELLTWPALHPIPIAVTVPSPKEELDTPYQAISLEIDVLGDLSNGSYVISYGELPAEVEPFGINFGGRKSKGVRFQVGSRPEVISVEICHKEKWEGDGTIAEGWEAHDAVRVHFSEELATDRAQKWEEVVTIYNPNGRALTCTAENDGKPRRSVAFYCLNEMVDDGGTIEIKEELFSLTKAHLGAYVAQLRRSPDGRRSGGCQEVVRKR